MAKIKCPICHEVIESGASSCPKCNGKIEPIDILVHIDEPYMATINAHEIDLRPYVTLYKKWGETIAPVYGIVQNTGLPLVNAKAVAETIQALYDNYNTDILDGYDFENDKEACQKCGSKLFLEKSSLFSKKKKRYCKICATRLED